MLTGEGRLGGDMPRACGKLRAPTNSCGASLSEYIGQCCETMGFHADKEYRCERRASCAGGETYGASGFSLSHMHAPKTTMTRYGVLPQLHAIATKGAAVFLLGAASASSLIT